MNFLTKMSIAQKLFLIPIIGSVVFLLYLGITTETGLRNVELLDDIIEAQSPALDATNSALVTIEKVRDTLSSAVIAGVDTVNKAGQSLSVITATMSRITRMNDLIAQSTGEQQSVANTISTNVDEIHQRTVETSHSSGKLASVSAELAQLAQHLEGITKQFKF